MTLHRESRLSEEVTFSLRPDEEKEPVMCQLLVRTFWAERKARLMTSIESGRCLVHTKD